MNVSSLRIAFFTDTFHEVNGAALTSRQFDAWARRRGVPFFSVRAARTEQLHTAGEHTVFELERSRAVMRLEADSDLSFDFLIWRYRDRLQAALEHFRPDIVHITGPGDVGMLGASMAYRLGVPLAASWHTNVHEYASRRLSRLLELLPENVRTPVLHAAEDGALKGAARFYALARVLFAPNRELVELLASRTGKPCFLMQRGIDTELFHPRRRTAGQKPFTIGYVGRLSVEKNVRMLAEIEEALRDCGCRGYRFHIIGPGAEAEWLAEHMMQADLPGVLTGEDLARAYAEMDAFVFPSRTDTFGNVILEAMASGVPVLVTGSGGPRYLVREGLCGFISETPAEFADHLLSLMNDPERHRQMRTAARDHALTFSWDEVFEGVCRNYGICLRASAGE